MSDETIIAETFKKYPIFKRFERMFVNALIEALEKKEAEMKVAQETTEAKQNESGN